MSIAFGRLVAPFACWLSEGQAQGKLNHQLNTPFLGESFVRVPVKVDCLDPESKEVRGKRGRDQTGV